MLINDEQAVSIQYRNVCQSVTHEIAHQWFGNLVSIHWWNDVYVVEGKNDSFNRRFQSID
jgi:aminopeptidase N